MTMEYFGNVLTTFFYLIDAANSGKSMIRVLSEDTDEFVLLVGWKYREEMECKVQMERWDTMLDNNSALSNCALTSYPYAKAKINELNTLLIHWRFPIITHGGNGRDAGGSDWDSINLFSSHCIVSNQGHPWSLPASHSSSRWRKVPKSKPCLQHQPTCSCTCCGPICRP